MSQNISIVVSKISDNVECILYGENWCFCPKIVDFDVSKIAMWNDLVNLDHCLNSKQNGLPRCFAKIRLEGVIIEFDIN